LSAAWASVRGEIARPKAMTAGADAPRIGCYVRDMTRWRREGTWVATVLIGMCLTAAMLVQAATARPPTGSETRASTSAGTGSVVPLVVCRTTFAASPGKPVAFPSSTTLAVSTRLASSLAAYTDTQGYVTVIGLREWKCSANYGADGVGGVSISPKGSVAASGGEAIVARETSACAGCTAGQACALFPAAARAYRAIWGSPCPTHRPKQESIHALNTRVVAFTDPPYVKGDGVPSGGRFPANGVMTYVPGSHDGSYLETCTLPDNVRSTCTAILNDFVARYGGR
jgi:hypothetical protein